MNRGRGYAAVGLVEPKTPANMGSVLRAAGCFDAGLVVYAGQRPQRLVANTRAWRTDTQKAYRHVPTIWHSGDMRDVIPVDCVPVALDCVDGARPLSSYVHPERAFYIFGPEDGTLDTELDWCRDIVRIETRHCLNLAGAVNIVLYDRMAKTRRGVA